MVNILFYYIDLEWKNCLKLQLVNLHFELKFIDKCN